MKKRRFVFVVSLLVLIIILAGLLYQNRNQRILGAVSVDVSEHIIYRIESTRQHNFYMYGKNLLIANNEGLTLIDKSGSVVWHLRLLVKSPIVKISGKYILVADSGGHSVTLVSNGKILASKMMEREILTARVNEKGYFAVITDEIGYKSKVWLYTRAGKEEYKWSISADYIVSIDISKNGKRLAASLVSTADDKLTSVVTIKDVDKETTLIEKTYPEKIYQEVKFLGDNSLIAIGESDTVKIDLKGNQEWVIDYGGKVLEHYDYKNDSNLVLAFRNSQNASAIEVYGKAGDKRGESNVDYHVSMLGVAADTIAASGIRQIGMYTHKGSIKTCIGTQSDFKWVGLTSDRGGVFVVSGNNIAYLKL